MPEATLTQVPKNKNISRHFSLRGKIAPSWESLHLKLNAHENLITKGKDSQFVTEHVPWTELPITVAGIYTVFSKSLFWGTRAKKNNEQDDWRALVITIGLLQFLLEKTDIVYWEATQKPSSCPFEWYCGIWLLIPLGVVP